MDHSWSPEDWVKAYTRKSRDDKGITPEELFRQHRLAIEAMAERDRIPMPPEGVLIEVGSSERIFDRPILSAIMEEVDRRPMGSRGHLLVPAADRVTRGDELEQCLIYARLRRAGVLIHQTVGGILDLNDLSQDSMRQMKGVVSRWLIEEYKAKVAGVRAMQLEKGEIRYGNVPWGYWWDKTEKLSRNRIKIDDREERRLHNGLTPWEALQRCCEEAPEVSLYVLADRYNVSYDTLRTTLGTPTICGYPVRKSHLNPERPKSCRQIKLPPEQWTWPKQAGDYPAACTRAHWHQMREAIHRRHDSYTRRNQGIGICRDVVCFEGLPHAHVDLTTMKHEKQQLPGYRCTGTDGRQRDVLRSVVDDHAKDAIRDLIADAEFVGYMIHTYYQQRRADPEPIHEEVRRLDEQLKQWQRELSTLARLARETTVRTLQNQYHRDAERLGQLIEEKEAEREAAFYRRSPIPAVDQAVPVFLALRRRQSPETWVVHWDQIWDRLDHHDQRRLVRVCIREVPVRYHQRVKHGRGTRELLPVRYSEFVEEARAAWVLVQESRACKIIEPQLLNELWGRVELLAAA